MDTNSRKAAPEAGISQKIFPDLREILPARIREARGALTGREFARRCGIVSQSLAKYERVGFSLPGAELLRRMAIATGVSADWLLGLTDERERCGARQVCPTATANATAPNATAIADAGAASILADALARVAALPRTTPPPAERSMEDVLRRLAATEEAVRALASAIGSAQR